MICCEIRIADLPKCTLELLEGKDDFSISSRSAPLKAKAVIKSAKYKQEWNRSITLPLSYDRGSLFFIIVLFQKGD